jgi:hypothetical protein
VGSARSPQPSGYLSDWLTRRPTPVSAGAFRLA